MAIKDISGEAFKEALDRKFFVYDTDAHNCVHHWYYLHHDDWGAAWFCDWATNKCRMKMPALKQGYTGWQEKNYHLFEYPALKQGYTGPHEVEDHLFEDNVIPFPCARSPCDF